MLGKLEQRRVGIRPHHHGVGVAGEHLRRIGDRLATTELGVGVIKPDRLAAELAHGDIERHARPRRGLLEDHHEDHVLDVFRPQRLWYAFTRLLHFVRHVDDAAQNACIDLAEIEKVAG